jgi:hypothetical protein
MSVRSLQQIVDDQAAAKAASKADEAAALLCARGYKWDGQSWVKS